MQADKEQRGDRRVRTMTSTGMEMYRNSLEKQNTILNNLEHSIEVEGNQISWDKSPEELHMIQANIVSIHRRYVDKSNRLIDFLTHQDSLESISERDKQYVNAEAVNSKVKHILDMVNQALGKENVQTRFENAGSVSHKTTSNYKLRNPSSANGSYIPLQELMEQKARAEAARVQMEYERKQLELKRMKAELVESEVKVKAEIQRRQNEVQANMDILNAEKNLSVAEAELKVFEQEIEHSEKFDTLSVYEEMDSQERTQYYIKEQQSFISKSQGSLVSLVPQETSPEKSHVLHLDTDQTLQRQPSWMNVQQPVTIPVMSQHNEHHKPFQLYETKPSVHESFKHSSVQHSMQPPVQQTQCIQSPYLTNEQAYRKRQPNADEASVHQDPQYPDVQFHSVQPHVNSQYPYVPNTQQWQHGNLEQPKYQQSYTPHPLYPQQMFMSEMTKLWVKKDILKLRLSKFTDTPGTFVSWKTTFQSVLQELGVSSLEELDLLQQYLGPESTRYAASISAANPNNPSQGVQKIWDRLNDKYGCPEVVEASLKAKLSSFPNISYKDSKKLFDLADLLSEIESVKENPIYSKLLSYFDTSAGINPVINKLPAGLQEKWVSTAVKYKNIHGVVFPPFSHFVQFIHELAQVKNDPCFLYEQHKGRSKEQVHTTVIKANKTDVSQGYSEDTQLCPIHQLNHSLNDCRAFRSKSLADRKQYLKEHGLCYKCCGTAKHLARDCRVKTVTCGICRSNRHPTGLHDEVPQEGKSHGGERSGQIPAQIHSQPVVSKCTKICKDRFSGRSCAKIVQVKVYPNDQPTKAVRAYCIIDDQSNKSLARSEFFDIFGEQGSALQYTLSSCSGTYLTSGRRASDYTVESLDGKTKLRLPTLIKCNQIPENKDEIPTPEIARCYPHLRDIAHLIPPVDNNVQTLLLLGRDIISAHHVLDLRLGSPNSLYGQKLNLGWVIIGETCVGKVHKNKLVNVNKTFILHDGQPSLHPPCINNFHVKESNLDSLYCEPDSKLFITTKDDNNCGKSTEDRQFEDIMRSGMVKNEQGNWEAPLPFKPDRQPLPNNKELALRRAKSLEVSLLKNETKREHFLTFMLNILEKGFAEEVPPLPNSEECWYLPIFGVYHPKKPGQIRVVFDSSAQCRGVSLNQVLLTGPNLTNDLLSILLRFRQGPVAATVDIQQMFYGFYVRPDHRKYLRFFWYRQNDINKGLVEYQMKVHVFGNTTSPAIATYALRKTVEESNENVRNFVVKNFYVDDGLLSTQTVQEAVNLIKETQKDLAVKGNLKLHKIASNSLELMNHFPNQDLSKEIQNLNITEEYLPFHQSLGLTWNLQTDSFLYHIPSEQKPYTKRGILFVVNSIFDPVGFIAPVKIRGKMLLREISQGINDWDEKLPDSYLDQWIEWTSSLNSLKDVRIPRSYRYQLSKVIKTETHIFSDASEKAIGAVAYLKTCFADNSINVAFLMGKAKLTPLKGHSLPRLELCAAVLAVEIHKTIQESLDLKLDRVTYYTDSQVVLGYSNNATRHFYTYVSNRVDIIKSHSKPSEWRYVNTKHNPADLASRSVPSSKLQDSIWLNGPKQNSEEYIHLATVFPLLDPENDKEIRQDVLVQKTNLKEATSLINRFTKFGNWNSLVRAICHLKLFIKSFKARKAIKLESESLTQNPEIRKEAENLIIKETQKHFYGEEIDALQGKCQINRNSSLIKLNPFLDSDGTVRVGGRLKNAYISQTESQPIILPGQSYVAKLIVRSCHEKVFHQGRHITEGAVRSSGYWVTGCKRLVTSLVYQCVTCRKLRGKEQHQLMADLPKDRLTIGAPFMNVGLDVFGPWQVVTRKTRGGVVNNKRWAVLFTCLCTRAVHIEILEEMSSSSFINALKRYIAIRGGVKIIRSDRGTNFIGAANTLNLNCINVEDTTSKSFLDKEKIIWIFNSPHSSHMGGVWERMIITARKIIDALLLDSTKNLTHEVLVTFLTEVSAIINSRPITSISTDPEDPIILSPALLLTHKDINQTPSHVDVGSGLDIKDMYRSLWKRVQFLSKLLWQKWKKGVHLHSSNTQEMDI